MATIKVKLRPSSVAGRAGTIFYQVTHRRATQQITTDMHVNIYPQRFKQLEAALEYVALSNITFEENSVNVALTMV